MKLKKVTSLFIDRMGLVVRLIMLYRTVGDVIGFVTIVTKAVCIQRNVANLSRAG